MSQIPRKFSFWGHKLFQIFYMLQVLLPHTNIMSKQWKIVPKPLIQLYPVIKQVLCFPISFLESWLNIKRLSLTSNVKFLFGPTIWSSHDHLITIIPSRIIFISILSCRTKTSYSASQVTMLEKKVMVRYTVWQNKEMISCLWVL